MKKLMYLRIIGLSLTFFLLISCEDWLEIDEPNSMIVSSTVFNNDESAKSAMQGIYNQLYRASFSAGWLGSVTVLSGLSSDILEPINPDGYFGPPLVEFDRHDLLANNSYIEGLWKSAYNVIYIVNALLEGVDQSTQISQEVAKRLEGEAKFVRAFTYFYLINLFGEVPLVLTTNYETNAVIKKSPNTKVYQQIIDDLNSSIELLETNYIDNERTYINRYAAMALLARVYLYLDNWGLAEKYSTKVIAQSSLYTLPKDLDQVFLANSQAAIWQLSPLGAGRVTTHTNEGSIFIIDPTSYFSYVKLSEDFEDGMQEEDKRRQHWIKYDEGKDAYFTYKYKVRYSEDEPTEYSMVLRLAEQYLIRAEARVQQNNLLGAIADLDKIRERAGLDLLSLTNPEITKEALFKKILEERSSELFTEWGHRWLDLKRIGKAGEILAPISPDWNETDKLYPLPEEELINNPKLTQNFGY